MYVPSAEWWCVLCDAAGFRCPHAAECRIFYGVSSHLSLIYVSLYKRTEYFFIVFKSDLFFCPVKCCVRKRNESIFYYISKRIEFHLTWPILHVLLILWWLETKSILHKTIQQRVFIWGFTVELWNLWNIVNKSLIITLCAINVRRYTSTCPLTHWDHWSDSEWRPAYAVRLKIYVLVQ